MEPYDRLAEFLAWISWSDAKLSRRLGFSDSYVRRVRARIRRPSLDFAVRLEALTREHAWPKGPILTEEWEAAPPEVRDQAGSEARS